MSEIPGKALAEIGGTSLLGLLYQAFIRTSQIQASWLHPLLFTSFEEISLPSVVAFNFPFKFSSKSGEKHTKNLNTLLS